MRFSLKTLLPLSLALSQAKPISPCDSGIATARYALVIASDTSIAPLNARVNGL